MEHFLDEWDCSTYLRALRSWFLWTRAKIDSPTQKADRATLAYPNWWQGVTLCFVAKMS